MARDKAIFRCRAPLRISFGGGGTDVDPYRAQYGGCTLSTTIDKYAYVSCRPRQDEIIEVRSLDYDIVAKYRTDDTFVMDGELDLAKAVIARLRHRRSKKGFDLFMHSDAPPGSGLGSSSTMVVALVSLFKDYFKRPLTSYEIAEAAYEIERIELGLKGGMQDQYAATFGGFNFIEFHPDKVIVNPLRLEPETVYELHYSLVFCYTGRTRQSAGIIDDQVKHIEHGEKDAVASTHELKDLCIQMKNALLQNRLTRFGELLHESWQAKKRIAARITNPDIDEMYEEARKQGAVGGKLLGAGGGGYLLLFAPFDRKHVIMERLEAVGGQVVEFNFDTQGAVTWRASE
ncbi:MAG: GHMP kinase [Candidatus Hydrogenedentes bacterium]|nr:GHMP kinase [Candidatus Hydrogenedentota bacterium]